MEMNLQEIPFTDLELWENSPRLPQSLQETVKDLTSAEKMELLIPFYVFNTHTTLLARAISTLGWSPIEPLWTIRRNGKFVVADGASRVVAVYLLLHPNHPACPKPIRKFAVTMSEEIKKSLETLTVMEFNSSMYSLDALAKKSK